jgi:hypothetical protein
MPLGKLTLHDAKGTGKQARLKALYNGYLKGATKITFTEMPSNYIQITFRYGEDKKAIYLWSIKNYVLLMEVQSGIPIYTSS